MGSIPRSGLLISAAVLLTALSGGEALANCTQPLATFAVFQCSGQAWFDPPATPVTFDPNDAPTNLNVVFWQVGFGNGGVNDGSGNAGTGIGAGGRFNGNDSGKLTIEMRDAHKFLLPYSPSAPAAGAVCLRNSNWGNSGVDGCCDNPRDATLAYTDDDILNPIFDVEIARTSSNTDFEPSTRWVQDSPMMILLRDQGGTQFAVAAVSTLVRTIVSDQRPGFYDFTDVANGLSNGVTGAHNVVPWQDVPGRKSASDPLGLVRGVGNDPSDPNRKLVSLGWVDATVYSDDASRPSTNATVTGGMGTAEAGPLVRYVVETQAIVNPNDPIGSLNPSGWTAGGTFHNPANGSQISVLPDTCIRLHTYFGKEPATSTISVANCRLGLCGDLGYEVVSPPSCIGGPLFSETPTDLQFSRAGSGTYTISWSASIELTTTSYRIDAVTRKGAVTLGSVPASSTGTGTGASYAFTVAATQLKGAKTVEVVALPSGAKRSVSLR